jgi:hypothetical protein
VTDVGTTTAPAPDVDQLGPIRACLAARQPLPSEHVVDTGYVGTGNLVASRHAQQIDLVGPMYDDRQWQAKDPDGFDWHLVLSAGWPLMSAELLRRGQVPGDEHKPGVVHATIRRLLRKLEPDPAVPRFALSKRTIGYVLPAPSDPASR